MGLRTFQTRILRAGMTAVGLAALVSGCSVAGLPAFKPAPAQVAAAGDAPVPLARPELTGAEPFQPMAFVEAPDETRPGVDGLIGKYALMYGVPESLVRRVVARESGFNPAARHGPYYGLMQIRHDTARTMGYQGEAAGLLDAETNLRYAVKYLRGAYMVANYDADAAVRFYSSGYYFDARRMGLLEEIGLR